MNKHFKNALPWALAGIIVLATLIVIIGMQKPGASYETPVVIVDDAYTILEELSSTIEDIEYSAITDKEFEWNHRINEEGGFKVMISGKQISSIKVDGEQREKIVQHFINKGFEQNIDNSISTEGVQNGILKGNMACIIHDGAFTEGQIKTEVDTGITILCGPNPQIQITE